MAFELKGLIYNRNRLCFRTNAGRSLKVLQRGDADIIISGGTEAPQQSLSGIFVMKALSTKRRTWSCQLTLDKERDGL